MAKVMAQITASVLQGQTVQLTVQGDIGPPVTVAVPLVPSESEDEFLRRARQMVRDALVHTDHANRRGSRFPQVAGQITMSLDRPDPALVTRAGSLLSGRVAPGTAALLLVLQDPAGATRQARVTPTRTNDPALPLEFSVHLGDAIALTLTPVGSEGLLGADQRVA